LALYSLFGNTINLSGDKGVDCADKRIRSIAGLDIKGGIIANTSEDLFESFLFNLSHVDGVVHLRLDQVVFLLLLLKFLVVIKTLQLVLLIQLLDILFILLLRQSFLTQFVQNCLLSFLFFLFEFVFVALLSEDVGTEYVFVLFIILDLEG